MIRGSKVAVRSVDDRVVELDVVVDHVEGVDVGAAVEQLCGEAAAGGGVEPALVLNQPGKVARPELHH